MLWGCGEGVAPSAPLKVYRGSAPPPRDHREDASSRPAEGARRPASPAITAASIGSVLARLPSACASGAPGRGSRPRPGRPAERQRRRDDGLEAAGRLDGDQRGREALQPQDELHQAFAIAGEDEASASRALASKLRCRHKERASDPILAQAGFASSGPSECSGSMKRREKTPAPPHGLGVPRDGPSPAGHREPHQESDSRRSSYDKRPFRNPEEFTQFTTRSYTNPH